jgi:hypothetical protein
MKWLRFVHPSEPDISIHYEKENRLFIRMAYTMKASDGEFLSTFRGRMNAKHEELEKVCKVLTSNKIGVKLELMGLTKELRSPVNKLYKIGKG